MLHKLQLEIPPDARAVASVRRAVDAQRLPAGLLDDVQIVLSELVTNAIRHARVDVDQKIAVRMEAFEDHVRVEVTDHGPGFDPSQVGDGEAGSQGGFGLLIVARLSRAWGVAGHSGTVWAELARRG